MPENSHPDPKNLDDELASFADSLLRGEEVSTSSPLPDSAELVELQDTVRWLSGTLNPVDPEAAMAERIRLKLIVEWKSAMAESQREAQQWIPWWKRWLTRDEPGEKKWHSARRSQQGVAFVLAGAALLILLFFLSIDFVGFGGTAAAGGSLTVALLGAGLGVLLGAAIWLSRRRK